MSLLTEEEEDTFRREAENVTFPDGAREYCRNLVWSVLHKVSYDECRHHDLIVDEFREILKGMRDPIDLGVFMIKFLEEVVIISEGYDVTFEGIQKRRELCFTYQNDTLSGVLVKMTCGKNDEGEPFESCSVVRVNWDSRARRSVIMREYADRYEEIICNDDYVGYLSNDSTKETKVTYKRDLFRKETLQPLHEELLYSLDITEKFPHFVNEAIRVKEHYESMQQ